MMKRAIILLAMFIALSFAAPQMSVGMCYVNGVYYGINETYKTAEVVSPSKYGRGESRKEYAGDVVVVETVMYKGVKCTVVGIDEEAFMNCTSLTSVKLPSTLTYIDVSAFEGCTRLTSVDIPDAVSSINNRAFYGCTGLAAIDIPNSVVYIGDYAFEGCSGLMSLTLGNSVRYICKKAFYGCSGLTSLYIPKSVTSILDAAFDNCTELMNIKVEAGNPTYDSRNNCNALIITPYNELVLTCRNTFLTLSLGHPIW